MARKLVGRFVFLNAFLVFSVLALFAQNENQSTRFSHKGIKGAVGLGTFDIPSESKLAEGQAVFLNLGYGFNDKSTLWLSLVGAEHPDNFNNNLITEFDAIELNFQYKFSPQMRFQPYGKVGIGGYQLKERVSNLKKLGGGLTFALGADYFFSNHFGIGLEFTFKDIQYSRQSQSLPGGELVSDIEPKLNRDSRGFMFTLTIQ